MKIQNFASTIGLLAGLGVCAVAATAPLGCTAETTDISTVKGESIATTQSQEALSYSTDFFDGFDGSSLNGNNWQDQAVWVNGENQCYDNYYNENGAHRTLEVSGGSLKLRVVDAGYSSGCNNWDKNGNKHPDTRYKGARIASKNRKEYAGGKWTARLRFYSWLWNNNYGQATGVAGMFPAWWLLGARNNEAPVQQGDENVCWPMVGSSEIDILEHYFGSGQNSFTSRGIRNQGYCNGGDWQSLQIGLSKDLNNYHEYQVENSGSDLIYRIDNGEVGRNWGVGHNYPDPFFAILNYALKDSNMDGNYKEYGMEIDWVKHESAACAPGSTVGIISGTNGLYASARNDVSGVPARAQAASVQGWEQFDVVDAGNGLVGLRSHTNNLFLSADMNDGNKTVHAGWATSIGGWEQFRIVGSSNGYVGLQANANGLFVSADMNNSGTLEAKWATSIGNWEQFQCIAQ